MGRVCPEGVGRNIPISNEIFLAEKSLFQSNPMVPTGTFINEFAFSNEIFLAEKSLFE
jgi:hypothetical protein